MTNILSTRTKRKNERKKLLKDLLGGSCVSCGRTDNLEFDHVIPEEKSFGIAGNQIELGLDKMLVELQKCQLLCKSCHREKTNLDIEVSGHGIPSMYSNKGCRCDKCRLAWNEYTRKHSSKYYYSHIDVERVKRREYSRTYNARKKLITTPNSV